MKSLMPFKNIILITAIIFASYFYYNKFAAQSRNLVQSANIKRSIVLHDLSVLVDRFQVTLNTIYKYPKISNDDYEKCKKISETLIQNWRELRKLNLSNPTDQARANEIISWIDSSKKELLLISNNYLPSDDALKTKFNDNIDKLDIPLNQLMTSKQNLEKVEKIIKDKKNNFFFKFFMPQ